ncbi:MAG: hypothetical protein L0Y64_04850 [Myxococcaceae bacterium]|nr:hypothetical protein [Myxococcaceae bacterium]
MDSWMRAGVEYVPDSSGDVLDLVKSHQLVLPPAPSTAEDSSEALWRDLRAFMQQWVALAPEFFDVIVAYVLLTYRLEDASFPYVPYLRFHGKPESGKGRALEVVRELAWRGLQSKPTANNLHRVVQYFGDVTLVVDEFHLDRGMGREAQETLIDTLNLGYHRSDGMLRVDDHRGQKIVRNFRLFGPKVFAGYGCDEHEALARRTVSIEMGKVDVPDAMDAPALALDFYAAAEALRARLLAWRGRKLSLGMPDPRSARASALRQRAGRGVAQVFWPLAEMVPEGMESELEAIYRCAEARRADTRQVREVTPEGAALEALANLWQRGAAHESSILTEDVAAEVDGEPVSTGRMLRKLGLVHHRVRAKGGRKGAFLVSAADPVLQAVMDHYGVAWPREGGGKKEAAL